MKKIRREWLLQIVIACFIVCFLMLAVPAKTKAAPAKKKALEAYKKFLSQDTIKWNKSNRNVLLSECFFALICLNDDLIPELLISSSETSNAEGYVMLYTYKNGKAKYRGTFWTCKYYKKKGLIVSSSLSTGIETTSYYKLSGGKLKQVLMKSRLISTNEINYTNVLSGKSISKSSFNKKLKNYVGSKKKSSIKFYANTTSNRNKYLK